MPGSGQSATFEGQIFENDDRPSIEEMEARRVAKEMFRHEHNLFKIEVSFSFGARPEVQMEEEEEVQVDLSIAETDVPQPEMTPSESPSSDCAVQDSQPQDVPIEAPDSQADIAQVNTVLEAQHPGVTTDDALLQTSEQSVKTQSEQVSEAIRESQSEPVKIEGELSFDFWLPVRKEDEGEDMWHVCTGYAVRGYPWTSTIRSGFGNVSVTGDENKQNTTISLRLSTHDSGSPSLAPSSIPITVSIPLPVASTWAMHDEIQLPTVYGSAAWGTYTAKASRVRKDEFCKVHGFHAKGQAFHWAYDEATSDGLVSAFGGLSYYLKYE